MKPSELVPHRTSEELEHAYRQAERPVERSRWHLLWLKSKGKMILEFTIHHLNPPVPYTDM